MEVAALFTWVMAWRDVATPGPGRRRPRARAGRGRPRPITPSWSVENALGRPTLHRGPVAVACGCAQAGAILLYSTLYLFAYV